MDCHIQSIGKCTKFMEILIALYFIGILSFSCVEIDAVVYRSYQSTIYCNASFPIQVPTSEAQLIDIIQGAIVNGQTVKAIGSRKSVTDVICTNGVPISMENINHSQINSDGTATFGAGITLTETLEFLEYHNMSLINIPAFTDLTLGGAIGTGTHGTSHRHSATISDQVLGMTVITGNGTFQEVSGTDLDIFRVHLGLLGIVVNVTLRTVPLYKMTVENRVSSDRVLFDGTILSELSSYDVYRVWWFPDSKNVVIGRGEYVSLDTPGNAYSYQITNMDRNLIEETSYLVEKLQATGNTTALNELAKQKEFSLYNDVIGKPPFYTYNGEDLANPATGIGWRLLSSICTNEGLSRCTWANEERKSIFVEESSMAFEISQFSGVMNNIRSILNTNPASFAVLGVYIRFLKESPKSMSISSGRTSFTVEWATHMRHNPYETSRDAIGTYQAILQGMIANYGGRPHWGKNGLHYFSQSVLLQAVPNRQDFVLAMWHYDPNGLFLNAFGRRILGVSEEQDRDPEVTRCALQDYCVCNRDEDCANFENCSRINGFPTVEMFEKQTEFFSLPASTKGKYRIKSILESYNGFTPFQAEKVSNVNPVSKVHSEDLRECYDFTLPKKTFIYPDEVKDWEPVIGEFTSKLTNLAKMIFRCFAIHLNLEDQETFVKMHEGMDDSAETNNCHIRCSNYFPPDPKHNFGKTPLRLGAHRDISTMTFLLQDSVGGLEVQFPNGEWIPAPAIPGAIILNAGFMMELFSGGQLTAAVSYVKLF